MKGAGVGSGSGAGLDREQREKEEGARVARQRGMLRVVGELELVAIVRGKGAVGELSWGILKELVSHHPRHKTPLH